jgi:MFS family permease
MKDNPQAGAGVEPSNAITLTVLAISSLTIMANTTIAPALPSLAERFSDVPNIETLLGLLLSLPSLAIIVTAAFMGLLAERIGRLPVLGTSLLLYALGGASGLFVDDMTGLLIGRIILGIGVAGTMTVATMLAADYWTGQARAKFMGKQAAVMSMGGMIFLLLGGFIAEYSWRGAFGLYLMSIPVFVLAWKNLKGTSVPIVEHSKNKAPLDWGICLKIGGLGFFTMAVFYLIPTRLPFLLVEMGHTSPATAAIAIASTTLAGVVSSVNFQKIRNRLSPVGIYALGFFLMFIGFALIATGSHLAQVIIGGLFIGLGLGAVMPNQSTWLMDAVNPEARGRAAGILTTFVFAGQFAGPLLAGLVALVMPQREIFTLFAAALALMAVVMFVIAYKEPAADSRVS